MTKYRLLDCGSQRELEEEVNALLADGYTLIGELRTYFEENYQRWIRELVKTEPSYSLGGSFRDYQEGVC